jgi:hypothetical protein
MIASKQQTVSMTALNAEHKICCRKRLECQMAPVMLSGYRALKNEIAAPIHLFDTFGYTGRAIYTTKKADI